MSMKSVLMISPYFVPRRRVGALRTFKFAIHLREFGYEPVILTIKDSKSLATPAEKKLLSKLKIIELSTPVDRTNRPEEENHSDKKTGVAAAWIDRHTPSDTWIYFYLYHYARVLKYAKKVKPNVIWATGDPWSSLVTGSMLAKKLRVPFVSDFRDPWTRSGISLRDRSAFAQYWDKKLESRVLQNSSKVVFTSTSAEKDYTQYFRLPKDKTSVIYNSYNDQVDSQNHNRDNCKVVFKPEDLNVVFYGTFRRLSPISPAADLLSEFRNETQELYKKIKIHSFGKPDSEQMAYAEKRGVEDRFIFHQKVKPEEGEDILKQSDILLLSTHPERENIVPAKLWDYLNTDVPILSVLPNPEVGKIIGETNSGAHFHPDNSHKAAEWLVECARKKQKQGIELLRRAPLTGPQKENITSQAKAGQLAEIFDEITADD